MTRRTVRPQYIFKRSMTFTHPSSVAKEWRSTMIDEALARNAQLGHPVPWQGSEDEWTPDTLAPWFLTQINDHVRRYKWRHWHGLDVSAILAEQAKGWRMSRVHLVSGVQPWYRQVDMHVQIVYNVRQRRSRPNPTVPGDKHKFMTESIARPTRPSVTPSTARHPVPSYNPTVRACGSPTTWDLAACRGRDVHESGKGSHVDKNTRSWVYYLQHTYFVDAEDEEEAVELAASDKPDANWTNEPSEVSTTHGPTENSRYGLSHITTKRNGWYPCYLHRLVQETGTNLRTSLKQCPTSLTSRTWWWLLQ